MTWAVYAYRDLWPLATCYLAPADEGNALLWTKFALLTVAAVVVPLTLPRKYVPCNPQVRLLLPVESLPSVLIFNLGSCGQTNRGADLLTSIIDVVCLPGSCNPEWISDAASHCGADASPERL